MALIGGGTALLTDALTVAGAAAIAVPRRLLSRAAVPALTIAAAASGGWALAGGRGTVVLPIAAGLLTRWLYWRRPSVRTLVLAGVLAGGFLSFLFYIRTGQNPPDQAFPTELYGTVVPGTPAPLVPLLPLHFAIAMNFEAFARIVDFFPGQMAYGHGIYDAYGLHAILPGRSLGTVSLGLSAPWLASTAAGPLWADGGPLVVAIGMLLTGAITTAPHALYRRTYRFTHALLAAYFLYLAVFGLYTSLLTQYKDWVFVAAGLVWIGWTSEGDAGRRLSMLTAAIRRPGRPPREPSSRGARSRLLTFVPILLLVVIVGAAVIVASRRGVSRQVGSAIVATEHVSLGQTRIGPADTLVTDGDLPTDDSAIWALARVSGGLRVVEFDRGAPRSYASVTRTVKVTTGPATRYALAGGHLYLIDERASAVTVRVVDPSHPAAPARAVGRAALKPPAFGAVRDFFVAHWSGVRPSLFVIERGSTLARLIVRIYSGDSGMASRVLLTTPQVRGLNPRTWDVRLVRFTARPDVVLVKKLTPARTEVHVLGGVTNYHRFVLQERLALPVGQVGADTFLAGDSLGAPSLLAVDRRRGDRVDVYPLGPLAPSL